MPLQPCQVRRRGPEKCRTAGLQYTCAYLSRSQAADPSDLFLPTRNFPSPPFWQTYHGSPHFFTAVDLSVSSDVPPSFSLRASHACCIRLTENGQDARRILSTLLQLLRCLVPPGPQTPAGLRSFQQVRSCTVTDGPVTSAARQTARNARTTGTVVGAAAVAVAVTAAVAVAVTAAAAGGHCPPLRPLPRPFLLRVLSPAPAPARYRPPLRAHLPQNSEPVNRHGHVQ